MEPTKGVHHFATEPFNWYVLEEAGRVTLVDAGFPGHFEVFTEGLRSIGRDIQDVEAVILTHAHADYMVLCPARCGSSECACIHSQE